MNKYYKMYNNPAHYSFYCQYSSIYTVNKLVQKCICIVFQLVIPVGDNNCILC